MPFAFTDQNDINEDTRYAIGAYQPSLGRTAKLQEAGGKTSQSHWLCEAEAIKGIAYGESK